MSAKLKPEARRFQTSATYINPPGDQMDPESITEQHGFIPLKSQVKMLIDSGKFLDAFRKEYYDTMDIDDIETADVIFDEDDPTLDQGYDIAEASMVALEIEERARALARRANEARKASKKKDEIDFSSVDPESKPKDKSTEGDSKDTDKNVK